MEKTTTPGFYMKKEWRELFDMISNEEIGTIIQNMYRLDDQEELLEMTPTAKMLFMSQIKTTQEFNKIKYEKKISANKENGAKGGAPSGNQNARKTTQINPKQHKDIDKDIVKEIGIDKNKEIGRVIEKAKSLTNNENSSIDNSSLHSIESLNFDKEKVEKNQENISNQNITNNNRNNSLPAGAITVAEYYRNQGKL